MNSNSIEQKYLRILETELQPALGCTEPIAIAYAGAKAREVLGAFPDRVEVCCSGNIIKNVKGVNVPNSGGMKGVEAAALLGIVGGVAERKLEVLQQVGEKDIEQVQALLKQNICTCLLKEGVANLYVEMRLFRGDEQACVILLNQHTNIVKIEKNGQVLFSANEDEEMDDLEQDKDALNLHDILQFADTVEIEKVRSVLQRQVEMNLAIANEGMEHPYGAQIGRTLQKIYGDQDVHVRARMMAAAGSDARMNGCSMPVVINSGSGNQGITASMPVWVYAQELGAGEEKLYRALVVSNLVALHQKHYIGRLSAYCGAVSAAAGSAAAVVYLKGGNERQVAAAIVNTLATISGMVCDGAKASCAAKISVAVETAMISADMAMADYQFEPGDGLVMDDIEQTVRGIGRLGRVGMKETDIEILKMMIGA